jgi:hypothetical protein
MSSTEAELSRPTETLLSTHDVIELPIRLRKDDCLLALIILYEHTSSQEEKKRLTNIAFYYKCWIWALTIVSIIGAIPFFFMYTISNGAEFTLTLMGCVLIGILFYYVWITLFKYIPRLLFGKLKFDGTQQHEYISGLLVFGSRIDILLRIDSLTKKDAEKSIEEQLI